MIDEKTFSQAVTLTAAFVANGDIRCGGSTNIGSTATEQVGDMVTTLYEVLLAARMAVENSGG